MIFKDCYPGPLLRNIVQVYRLRHFRIPSHLTITPKPYPTRPEHCITFYIRGFELTETPWDQKVIRRPRSIISGQYTQRINRYSGNTEFLMIQAVLLPGVLHRLTGIPSHELQNDFIDLEDVFPVEGHQINERLQNCTEYAQMLTAVENFIFDLSQKSKVASRPADAVFQLMLYSPGKYSIDWLAKEACYSPRQFERKAHDYLGIGPKLFMRIARFTYSYDLRQKQTDSDWLSIAVASDYHDYQHLVKDYREFAGASPNQLLAAESQALERRLGLITPK